MHLPPPELSFLFYWLLLCITGIFDSDERWRSTIANACIWFRLLHIHHMPLLYLHLNPLSPPRQMSLPLLPFSPEGRIKTEPKTVFSPTNWKGCTEKFQTSKLKSGRRIPWTTPTALWVAELCKEVQNNSMTPPVLGDAIDSPLGLGLYRKRRGPLVVNVWR